MSLKELVGRGDVPVLLDELSAKELNFDPGRRAEFTPGRGWHFDFYRQPLPGESLGPPVPGGSWETACGVLQGYEFVDPSIVRAFFPPDAPLEGRDMLLEANLIGLHFYMGVRVVAVVDESREEDGRRARVWGWSYATLEDHLEMGQMDYEVWKWLDSGAVEFRIHAFSRVAHIPNPVVRLGFRVLGRSQQKRFARLACKRMARLSASRASS